MSGIFGSSQWMYASGGFYNGVATQSLRFDSGSSNYLEWTPSTSSTSTRTFTVSTWVKLGNLKTGSDSFIWCGQNVSGTTNTSLNFKTFSGEYYFQIETGGQAIIFANQLRRDVSAWYHVIAVFDTTQATSTNRIKLYVNGEQMANSSGTFPSQNTDYDIGGSNKQMIGALNLGSAGRFFDGYMSEFNFVDGSALDPTSFGEFKNGVWIPIEYTGSYGTNGFRLQFNQTGTGTASSSTIGADTSGNANHFSSSGIVASDCDMPDSPENNFCTLNPTRGAYGNTNPNGTLAEGNLKFSAPNQTYFYNSAGTIFPTSGKWYWEVFIVSNNDNAGILGIVTSGGDTKEFPGWDTEGLGYGWASSNGNKIHNNTSSSYVSETALANDIAGIALDLDNGTLTFYHNNASQGQAFSSIDSSKGWSFGFGTGYLTTFVANFGQDSSFAGNKTSGSANAQDANGIGDFFYSPPSGYLALCTANLPEPTISPNAGTQADDYFNTATYSGNSSTQNITSVGFQPDWVWIKSRSNASNHYVTDVVRGTSKGLQTNISNAEVTNTNVITSFNSDGFSLGDDATANVANITGRTYVSWNWKAGGTAVSNTDGSITSSVSANTDAGFSIVTYTGNSTAGATVGHGLDAIPDFLIIKNRDKNVNWGIWHSALTDSQILRFTSGVATSPATPYFEPQNNTSSVFSLGTNDETNFSGDDYIAYCFHNVEGYSKFGSYTGNGSADGTFVYLGFRPAFIIIKQTNTTNNWIMMDNKRGNINPDLGWLYPDDPSAEDTGSSRYTDFVSNGMKIRNGGTGMNTSGGTYIYMAFAENPFKYANAR